MQQVWNTETYFRTNEATFRGGKEIEWNGIELINKIPNNKCL
jgi:hypothetical protein